VIRGVGIDAVPIERMRLALERTPGLAARVFTAQELETSVSRASREASLAARFAAKEACRKALGVVIAWRDVEVVASDDRVPSLHVVGYESMRFHVSLTHTDEIALAVVLAENDG
jgi:holo-[acyl-carrier protein] synthase